MSSIRFTMPDVGEGIAQAEIIEWFVEVGDDIAEHDPLCSVETDKSLVEIPAPVTGTITERGAEVGSVVPVGGLLAIIASAQSEPTTGPSLSGAADLTPNAPSGVAGGATGGGSTATRSPIGRRPLASPRTRRLAVQRGIDLTHLVGTGPHGRILESDLDSEPQASSPSAAATLPEQDSISRSVGGGTGVPLTRRPDDVIELRGLRRSIAQSMTQALTIPHVIEFREIDATGLLAAHTALRSTFEKQGLRFSLFPLLLKAAVRSLQAHPSMNATFDAERGTVTRHGTIHLGMATSTDDGLIVPVIRDADQLPLGALAATADRLADAARRRTANPQELSGGTCTVTNFGSFGTWLGTPIIRPPEVGIIGFGRITERVIPVDGAPAVRPVLPVVVATDHRVHDGSHLAAFMGTLTEALIEPILLLA